MFNLVWVCAGPFFSVSILVFVFALMISLLGLQFFNGMYYFDYLTSLPCTVAAYNTPIRPFYSFLTPSNCLKSRANYENLLNAFFSTMQLFTAENWDRLMYDGIRSVGYVAILYFIPVVLIGHYLLMNLYFVAILAKFKASVFGSENEFVDDLPAEVAPVQSTQPDRPVILSFEQLLQNALTHLQSSMKEVTEALESTGDYKDDDKALEMGAFNKHETYPEYIARVNKSMSEKPLIMWSCLVFSPTNPLRRLCAFLVRNIVFESVVTCLLLISIICLIIENPLDDHNSYRATTLSTANFTISCIFLGELCLKLVVYGVFLNGPDSYFRSIWNWVEALSTIAPFAASIAVYNGNLAAQSVALQSFRQLRVFRALRVVRIAIKLKSIKQILDTIVDSVPQLISVYVVLVIWFLVTAIAFVNYLKGALSFCVLPDGLVANIFYAQPQNPVGSPAFSISSKSDCLGTGTSASSNFIKSFVNQGYQFYWATPQLFFDNIGYSLMTLITVSTTEGWVKLTNALVDSSPPPSVTEQNSPGFENNLGWIPIMIVFIVVSRYFIMNFFVAATVNMYLKRSAILDGSYKLSTDQERWVEVMNMMSFYKPRRRPQPPEGAFRAMCWDLARSPNFNAFITALILMNAALLATQYAGMSDLHDQVITYINAGFTFIFAIELFLKLVAFGPLFFGSYWNWLDLGLILGSTIGAIIRLQPANILSQDFVRVFNVVRLLRLLKLNKWLYSLVRMLVVIRGELLSLCVLLLFIYTMYAIVGVHVFADVMPMGPVDYWNGEFYSGQYLPNSIRNAGPNANNNRAFDAQNNFQTFGNALLALVRCTTGESWQTLMASLAVSSPTSYYPCVVAGGSFAAESSAGVPLGCGTSWSYVYFISFQFIVVFTFMNLFIAIVFRAFHKTRLANSNDHASPNDIKLWSTSWTQFDPRATGYINVLNLPEFLRTLPLGIRPAYNSGSSEELEFIDQLAVPVYEGTVVHWVDVMSSLSRNSFMKQVDDPEFDNLPPTLRCIQLLQRHLELRFPEIHYLQMPHVEAVSASSVLLPHYRDGSIITQGRIPLEDATIIIKKIIERAPKSFTSTPSSYHSAQRSVPHLALEPVGSNQTFSNMFPESTPNYRAESAAAAAYYAEPSSPRAKYAAASPYAPRTPSSENMQASRSSGLPSAKSFGKA